MKSAMLFALGLILSACSQATEPLTQAEIQPLQGCEVKADCTVARNGPMQCCGGRSGAVVAINTNEVESLYASFAEPEGCDGLLCPEAIDFYPSAEFAHNRYELSCDAGLCTINADHEFAGNFCDPTNANCPDDYECREATPAYLSWCAYTGTSTGAD